MSYSDDSLPPRILSIDPGTKRIGLAISDPFGNFPVGLDTIQASKNQTEQIKALCEQYSVGEIVMGLPLHMNGDEGDSAQMARELAKKLEEATGLNVSMMDERLTSKMAEQSLRELGVSSSKKRKSGIVDQTAAMILLQDYLNRKRFNP